DRLETLREFARLLGLCFQIKDDIFDYFSDEKIGKPTSNDLREGKVTLPLLHVLEDETNPEHDKMVALVRKDALEPSEIDTLIRFALEGGGVDYAYATMRRLRDEAASLLSRFPESPVRESFLSLIDFIITRDR
ncbi:MAG: polyprenyl synthetase family protein, partial [Muribaculaceae bacterium]|nr:polyprenyl synthetase family protein [Muribaculaceae bacterium]